MEADLARGEVGEDRLVVVQLEVDEAVGAERRDRDAGLCVERDEAIARRDVEDAFRVAVAPPGEPAAGELAGGSSAARPLVFAVDPEQLTGGGVECDDRAACAGGGIEDTVHHERRALELVFGASPEVVGLEAPGDFEVLEVGSADLVERGVAGTANIAGVGGPFAGGGGVRARHGHLCGGDPRRGGERGDERRAHAPRVPVRMRHPVPPVSSDQLTSCTGVRNYPRSDPPSVHVATRRRQLPSPRTHGNLSRAATISRIAMMTIPMHR